MAGRIIIAAVPLPPPPSVGFTPDSGYGSIGTPGWDGSFTVTNPSNPFGPTGPTLIAFDDWRNAVLGSVVAGAVPVAGSGVYANAVARGAAQIVNRPNRSGGGKSISVLNDEVAGSANGFGRGFMLDMGVTHGVYMFLAETSRGTGDYRNDEGNGGGYYKRTWLTGDIPSTGFGANAADLILPVFNEFSSSASLTSATWAAGTVTVTVSSSSDINLVPGYGSSWAGGIATCPSNASFITTPTNFSPSVPVTCTKISPTQFTFPLAANPGAAATNGTYWVPGSFQVNSPLMPSANINTRFGGNSTGSHGIPTSVWGITGDSNGIALLDPVGWNSWEQGSVGNSASPTTVGGIDYLAVYNAVNKRAVNATLNTNIWFSASDPNFAFWRYLHFTGLMQSFARHTYDRADFYLAAGYNAYCRFFIGDASTPANCTTIMPCTIDSWTAGSVTMKLRQGAFAIPSGNHLYWADASNNISHCGVFA